MTKYVAFAQVTPAYKTIHDCTEGCSTAKWIVNGRTSGLTRTKTTYACDRCLASVMSKQDWSK
jgi:hypothetical protein